MLAGTMQSQAFIESRLCGKELRSPCTESRRAVGVPNRSLAGSIYWPSFGVRVFWFVQILPG